MIDTKQRAAISDTFKNAGNRLLSPAEVCAIASEQIPGLGIATVYRNIKTMVSLGELQAVMLPGQADRYTLAESELGAINIHKDGKVTFLNPNQAQSLYHFTNHIYYIEK